MLHSFRGKVLLAILAVTMFTACAITLVFYYKYAGMAVENYSTNLYGRVRQTINSLDASLQEVYYVDVKASNDAELIGLALEFRSRGSKKSLDGMAEVLRSYQKGYRDISSLYLVFPEEGIAVTSEDYPVCKKNISGEKLEEVLRAGREEAVPVMVEDVVHDGRKQLSCVQPVAGPQGQLLGYLLVNTEERTLYYEYLRPVYDGEASRAVIVDKNARIITTEAYKTVGQPFELPEAGGILEGKGREDIRIFYQGIFSGCGLYLEIPKSEILKELNQIRTFILGIFLLFLILAGVLADCISRAMYKPIKTLSLTVEQVGAGDLNLRVKVAGEDEIAALSRQFNTMLDDIENLIGRVIEGERLKKDAELEALQYQITPHFMYNTLNSIKFAALMRGEKELGGLIGEFVELLQASISKKGTFLTVADELHILKNYIHLQEFRYESGFDVEYDIRPEAYGCYIPRLILQPLVENAILHGLDVKGGKGRLMIRGSIEEGTLTLSVSDNGRGMTEEQIEALMQSKAKKTSGLSAIGIPNVRERLELYYGERGGLRFESAGDGTTAVIFLPADRG